MEATPERRLPTADEVGDAAVRLDGDIDRTELFASAVFAAGPVPVQVKAEHRQLTGSFKLRGALNALRRLDPVSRRRGVVTASSGNHGIATARAAALTGTACVVHLPATASASKREALEAAGADVVLVADPDPAASERVARQVAAEQGKRYLSPYDDGDVIAGAGTVAIELLDQHRVATGVCPDAIVVAVGGGGLISGIATVVAEIAPATLVIGASPSNDQAMLASVAAGRVIDPPTSPTFSDGTAGGVDPASVTFESCRELVGRWESVSEYEIACAVSDMIDAHGEPVEGAAGVALAAARRYSCAQPEALIAVVSCGANVSAADIATMKAMAGRR